MQAHRKVSRSGTVNTLIGRKYDKNIVQNVLFLNYGPKTGTADAVADVPVSMALLNVFVNVGTHK